MDWSILLTYAWVLLVLIALEGLLSVDNAAVMAVQVKHLAPDDQKKALFYGLAGAFVFRLTSLFLISFLATVWQVQAIGATYLLFLFFKHLYEKHKSQSEEDKEEEKDQKGSGFWMTVLKVEVLDIAFAIDSILAAVALAITLPETSLPTIGGMDGAQFLVIFIGGFAGLIIIRYAAKALVKLLHKKPGLETAAMFLVAWVGVKLAIFTLAHEKVGVIPHNFPHSTMWTVIFWSVMVLICTLGWFLSNDNNKEVQA